MSKKLFASDAIGNVIVPPPEVLLAWRTDAYPHGERRTWITAFSIPMIAVSTVLVALRLGLRLRKRGGGFGLDDVSSHRTRRARGRARLTVFRL